MTKNRSGKNLVAIITFVLILIISQTLMTSATGYDTNCDNEFNSGSTSSVAFTTANESWTKEQISPHILDQLNTITKIDPIYGIKYNNGEIFYMVIEYSTKADCDKAFTAIKTVVKSQRTIKINGKYITILSDSTSSLAISLSDKYMIMFPLSADMIKKLYTYCSSIFNDDRFSTIMTDLVNIKESYSDQNNEEVTELVESVTEKKLGVAYGGRSKTWSFEVPEGFVKVEVATFGENKDETNKYGGYNAYMKINGQNAWETIRYNPSKGEDGRNIIDYISGTNEREPEGRGIYLDITKLVKSGSNELTYAHFGGGGIGIKLKITVSTKK